MRGNRAHFDGIGVYRRTKREHADQREIGPVPGNDVRPAGALRRAQRMPLTTVVAAANRCSLAAATG